MSEFRLPPVFFFALAMAAGIIVVDASGSSSTVPVAAGAAALLILAAGFKWPFMRKVAPHFLFFILGVCSSALLVQRMESGHLYRAAAAGREIEAVGTVIKEPSRTSRGVSFELRIRRMRDRGRPLETAETARVTLSGPGPAPDMGDLVRLDARALPPGGPDEELRRYLYHKGISAQLFASSEDFTVIGRRESSILAFAGKARARFKEGVQRSLPPENASLLNGMVLGDTRDMDEKDEESFRSAGLSHLVAVSGMNVMFLVGFVWPLLRFARASPAIQVVVLSAAVWSYALLTEASPSVLRASMMAEIMIVSWLLGRERTLTASIATTALILMIVSPFIIFDIGFQLSFAATFALVWLAPVIAEKMGSLPKGIAQAFAVSLAAQLGVAPLIAFYFGQVSMISLIANLAVVPAVAPSTILGLIGGLSDYLYPPLALVVYRTAGLFVAYVMSAGRFFASLPVASFAIPTPGTASVLAYYIALVAGFMLFKRWKGSLTLAHLALVILVPLVFATAFQVAGSTPPPGVEVSFLNVGQGDATLIREEQGGTILVDTGPDEWRVAHYLTTKGIRKIDLAVMTHEDADHITGFPAVFDVARVERIVVSPDLTKRATARILETARALGTEVEIAEEGRRYVLGRLAMDVVHVGSGGEENDQSLVTKLTFGSFSLLLPGDAEVEEERALAKKGGLSASVLKVPHHGGASSADYAFLRAVSPKVSIVSVGSRNRYGHPSSLALSRLRAVGSKIFRTDRDGTVMIKTDGNTMEIETEQ